MFRTIYALSVYTFFLTVSSPNDDNPSLSEMSKVMAKKKSLTSSQKRMLTNKFKDARKKITKNDVQYALKATKGKLEKVPGYLESFVLQVELLYKVLRDGYKGTYSVPWKVIAALTAALVYFIMPFDVIPDFIPFIGYIDDAFVVGLCIKLVHMELLEYCKAKRLNPVKWGIA